MNRQSGQVDPAEVGPIEFTVTFSEPVTGLTGADFEVSGTVGGTTTVTLSGSGDTYTASVSGMTTPGTVVLTLPQDAAVSSVTGLGNDASTSTDNTVRWSPPAPTVTVEQAAGQADPASAGPVQFTVTFSEDVTGLTGADLAGRGPRAGRRW